MYKRILVAVDGSPMAGQALQEAVNLAKALQAQMRVVNVVDAVSLNWPEVGDFEAVMEAYRESSRKILGQASAETQKAGVMVDTKMIEIDNFGHRVADSIAAAAEAWPADLIVIGTHGRHGMNRLLLGSVAEGVVRVSSKPVLLVRGT